MRSCDKFIFGCFEVIYSLPFKNKQDVKWTLEKHYHMMVVAGLFV